MDNNRTILAVVLIVLLWSGYSLFFAPQTPPQQAPPVEAVAPVKEKTQNSAKIKSVQDISLPDIADNDNTDESFLTVSSDYYEIKISTIGAAVSSIALKKYRETNDVDSAPFQLFAADSFDLSTLQTSGSDGLYLPANLNYKIMDGHDAVSVNSENVTVSFVATVNDLTFVKSYTFHPASYSFDLSVQVVNNS
ncbi:MAG: membrane protein insertase YidC, partial [Desulfuromusa sp.]|nr:membrane protein insertase YidC [Desulfuromusa sp.]